MNLVLSGPVDPTLLNLAVQLTRPREVVQLHAKAHRLIGADDGASSRDEIERLCAIARVDHAFVPEGLRFSDFKLLAMDMDSTLITIECIDEIADFAGKKKEVAAITEAAMRGEIPDFAESLRRRVALLAGTPVTALEAVYEERLKLTSGADDLVSAAKWAKIYLLLLSGGFTFFSDKLTKQLGLNESYANQLELDNDRLTGKLVEPILDGPRKASKLLAAMHCNSCNHSNTLVIGDGANDIPMMSCVQHSIAFHGKPSVKSEARYAIDFGGLATALDFLQ